MQRSVVLPPAKIIHAILVEHDTFPNNASLPFLIYKAAFDFVQTDSPEVIENVFLENRWKNPWTNGIYSYHHFHNNTHEVIGVFTGNCDVQLGGPNKPIYKLEKGDVLILPAGVAHKNVNSSKDFICIGAYPTKIAYDMQTGKAGELIDSKENIAKVPLPKTDPIYGVNGPLFEYWK